jgi:REP element-mobilizing transposase RayT
MARGVDGRSIFEDDRDRLAFLTTMRRLAGSTGIEILAYCLMNNHFHLAVKVAQSPLSQFMQRLLTAYSSSYNARVGRQGHLFQARYKAVPCLDEKQLYHLIRYIHDNPVRAGLVSEAGQWPWSSFKSAPDAPLDATHPEPEFDPWRLGYDTAASLVRTETQPAQSLGELLEKVAVCHGMSTHSIVSAGKTRALVRARADLCVRASRHGYSNIQIARILRCSGPCVSRWLKKSFECKGLTP